MRHWLNLAGMRHQQVFADLIVKNGTLASEYYHVTVDAGTWDSGQWWDYSLIGSAGATPNVLAGRQGYTRHPLYGVVMPSGCEVCKAIGFVFDPSADSAAVDRLMQFDLSCLTRLIHPCRTEADIMPNAWAQAEADRAAASKHYGR
jgi:hypothetical protein